MRRHRTGCAARDRAADEAVGDRPRVATSPTAPTSIPARRWAEVRARTSSSTCRRSSAQVCARRSPSASGCGCRRTAAEELRRAAATLELLQALSGASTALRLHHQRLSVRRVPRHAREGAASTSPTGASDERLDYTDSPGRLLADAPAGDGVDGSVSTVPGAFKPRGAGTADAQRDRRPAARARRASASSCEAHRQAHRARARARAVLLARDHRRDGRVLRASTCSARRRARALRELTGRRRAPRREQLLRRHLGVCLDACHAAVEFEEPRDALDRLARRRDPRSRRSSSAPALRMPRVDRGRASRARSRSTTASTCTRWSSARRRRLAPLPRSARGARRAAGGAAAREWRVHFHVPVFLRAPGRASTARRRSCATLLALQRSAAVSAHLEVETYTWDVLPASYRRRRLARRHRARAALGLDERLSCRGMNAARSALRLGRVSNLPTVWTNVLAGVVLSRRRRSAPASLPLLRRRSRSSTSAACT